MAQNTRTATRGRSASPQRTSAQTSRRPASARSAQNTAAAKADEAKQEVTGAVRTQLDQRSNDFGEQLSGTAGDIKEIASQLRGQDNDAAARIAELAAERIEQAADYLSTASGDKLMSDLEDVARDRPLIAAGGAVLLGFAASRALSASRRKRQGGDYVDLDAGADFDEADAESAYPDEPARTRA
jgi:hypothetical protein